MSIGRLVNRSGLSESLGVALSTVDQWVQGGMPYVKRPQRKGQSGWEFDLAEVLEWHRQRERENALGDIARIDESEAKRRKIAAEAALAEHELALKQGAAVGIADFEAQMSAMIGAARGKLLNLGSKLGPMVLSCQSPAEAKDMIDDAVREVLRELSEFDGQDVSDQPSGARQPADGGTEDGESMGTAPGADHKRVGGRKPPAKSRGKR